MPDQLPSFLKVCHRNAPDLDTCVRESYEELRPRLIEGIPELYIPAMEPLVVPQVKMDQDSGAIYLHSVYRNVKVTGISKHTGKIMMMPLLGDGHCNVDLVNITMRTELIGQEYKKNGANFLKINTVKVKYELSDVHIHLDNLFNGDKALGDRMNEFLNENWKALAEEVRPLMTKALVDILRASVDKLFASFSYDDLLPK
ncbi:GD20311 [Drosophila simulans]|uniref:GD20311 n=1 Tax=Drosophila simulans TaxID=7240 RepID=B4QXR2_DROSI|nr:GD20311 [Drosophila simulans]